ncbi:P-loop containing nucleoside triphosphate hydrolase protein [Mycotypha africana]|uniref:P-loop containing nucleoside triphosphate hydrolase protein n=1 Tax=Mycotypha africana TaxID=64632 RepID=UPI0023019A2A|nr:P-loop containing nucleoside triphosphate hydrolase protein [Mycotypha africana]KAI8981777.1 P-loop containing nucleoside triphosphate hydrolase protein [Mycotypha africana]
MTLPMPTMPERKKLLHYFLKKELDLDETMLDEFATYISFRTSGYVARDLKLLVRQLKLKQKRMSQHKDMYPDDQTLIEQFEQLEVSKKDDNGDLVSEFERLDLSKDSRNRHDKQTLLQIQDIDTIFESFKPPSQQQQLSNHDQKMESTLPKKRWDDIGGYTAIKNKIKQSILLPLLQPHLFTKLGIKPPSGLLLYGPSGCGKTALIQALITEYMMMNMIVIKGPEIYSKYLGETEHKIRQIFQSAKRLAPCIIFVDEMDSIGTKRGFDSADSGGGGVNERVLSTLLNEMDGIETRQGVIVIGCTNRPDQIDDAILRPGRLDQLIYVGLPDTEDRVDIIKKLIKKVSVAPATEENDQMKIDYLTLAKKLEFCTGADIENLFREAGTLALRRDINADYITMKDIDDVITPILERAEDQVLKGNLDIFERFLKEHS